MTTVWQGLNPLCSPLPRLDPLYTLMPISLTPCSQFVFPLSCLPYSPLSPIVLAILHLFATNYFKKKMMINDDCCGFLDNGCFHYGSCTSISGQSGIDSRCCYEQHRIPGRLVNRKAQSDQIKSRNNLPMIREPLTMLNPCCTKPITKMHLSTQKSWNSNKHKKLVGTKHLQ